MSMQIGIELLITIGVLIGSIIIFIVRMEGNHNVLKNKVTNIKEIQDHLIREGETIKAKNTALELMMADIRADLKYIREQVSELKNNSTNAD